MKKRFLCLLLALTLLVGLLCGCQGAPAGDPAQTGNDRTEATVPATVPADGNPNDVTCKGSYSVSGDPEAVVATMGSAKLTNGELQVWYWAQVAQYRQEGHEQAPDFDRPLDTQTCPIDSSVNTWQQYFLKRALNAWHGAQALMVQAGEEGVPTEEAYKPNERNHGIYLENIPATRFLYGYNEGYTPNTMHQAYLDNVPQMLEQLAKDRGYGSVEEMAQTAFGTTAEALTAFAVTYNWGYMYFTTLGYYNEAPTEEEVRQWYDAHKAEFADRGITEGSGRYVDIRHMLLVPENLVEKQKKTYVNGKAVMIPENPQVLEEVTVAPDGTVTCSEERWSACEQTGWDMLAAWAKDKRVSEATFAEMANKNSADPGSALNGGAYRQLRQGQLMPELDGWCFDESRQPGDTTVIRSPYGCHVLYFSGSTQIWYAEAEAEIIARRQADRIAAAKEAYPARFDYSAIVLSDAEPAVAAGDILYPDVAHERFPEIPLYLQQDYPDTMYGGFKITTNGCGITTMAMLATYMTDDELTPPEMCERYGRYSHSNGTDGMIFNYEPAVMGFYLKEKTYEWREAKAAMEEGHVVVVVQHKGFWTRGGHYLALEEMTEEGLVRVRDSNIYNYGKLEGHKEDLFEWSTIIPAGMGYWIFEYKITNIPACSRCGAPEGVTEHLLQSDYCCEKCEPAILRRETYLAACGQ